MAASERKLKKNRFGNFGSSDFYMFRGIWWTLDDFSRLAILNTFKLEPMWSRKNLWIQSWTMGPGDTNVWDEVETAYQQWLKSENLQNNSNNIVIHSDSMWQLFWIYVEWNLWTFVKMLNQSQSALSHFIYIAFRPPAKLLFSLIPVQIRSQVPPPPSPML